MSGNSAAEGGGIFSYYGMTTISASTLSGNVASLDGGGIVNFDGSTLIVENSSSITGNTAPLGFGADVYNLGVQRSNLASGSYTVLASAAGGNTSATFVVAANHRGGKAAVNAMQLQAMLRETSSPPRRRVPSMPPRRENLVPISAAQMLLRA